MGLLEDKLAAEMAQWPGFKAAALDEKKISENLSRPPKPDMGDFAFATFRFAKDAGAKPPELAARLTADAPVLSNAEGPVGDNLIAQVSASGPYVNLKLDRAAVFKTILNEIEDKSPGNDPSAWHYGDSDEGAGKTLVVDLSSPNIAKPLAVHHLRSTMIGYSIKKIRESQGWRVVGINHLGDWGTGFGKLIAGLKREDQSGGQALFRESLGEALNIGTLLETYKRFTREAETNPELANEARKEFAQLEQEMIQANAGAAPESSLPNFVIWNKVKDVSLGEFERVYSKLGLTFKDAAKDDTDFDSLTDDDYRDHCFYIGESFYVGKNDLCGEITDEAKEKGVAEQSDGALVIFTHGKKKPPLMLSKSDGATSYHARDMASALYRYRTFDLTDAAYVVGAEQSLHFQQLFKGLEMLGYEWAKYCAHVDFGVMLFKQPDGTWAKGSTRKGTAVMLEDLLDESVQAVREIIAEKNEELTADTEDAGKAAYAVGVGAVVFNDLKNGRRNNVKFDWDKVLDFQGESGPYMQMQYVRMNSVTQKYIDTYSEPAFADGDAELLKLDEEWAILQLLASFPDTVARASREYEPSIVARYLIELAGATSTWWVASKDTKIVSDDKELSLARVRLVNAIKKVLGRGLNLLSMEIVKRM